jgi:hypothetical protein
MSSWARVLAIAGLVGSIAAFAKPTSSLDESRLESAERIWTQQSLHSYEFQFRFKSFMTTCSSWAFSVSVLDEIPKPLSDCRDLRAQFSTVPLLFSYLRGALAKKHYLVEADFDPRFGYPTHAFVAWTEAADDFFSFDVQAFKFNAAPNKRFERSRGASSVSQGGGR